MIKLFKNKFFVPAIAVVALALGACEKDVPEVGGTGTEKMAGEWYVHYKTAGGVDLLGGYVKILTYNTAENKADSMWIDNVNDTLPFKAKAQVDVNALTFVSSGSLNEEDGGTVSFANGKILAKAGKSIGGNTVDSIYMEVKFAGNPETYIVSGHQRTGYREDEIE